METTLAQRLVATLLSLIISFIISLGLTRLFNYTGYWILESAINSISVGAGCFISLTINAGNKKKEYTIIKESTLKEKVISSLIVFPIVFITLLILAKLFGGTNNVLLDSIIVSISLIIGRFISISLTEIFDLQESVALKVCLAMVITLYTLFDIVVILNLKDWAHYVLYICIPFYVSLIMNNRCVRSNTEN